MFRQTKEGRHAAEPAYGSPLVRDGSLGAPAFLKIAGCIPIFHKYCCYTKRGRITTNLTLRNHLGVCYWCVQIPQCGYMGHGLKLVKFYIQKHIAGLEMCHNLPLAHDKPLGMPASVKLAYRNNFCMENEDPFMSCGQWYVFWWHNINIFVSVKKHHVVDNSCMVPIAPFSATNFSHMTLFNRFWGKHLFLQFWIQLLNETSDFRFCFWKWFGYMRSSKPFLRFSIHGKVFKIRRNPSQYSARHSIG